MGFAMRHVSKDSSSRDKPPFDVAAYGRTRTMVNISSG